MPPWPFTSVSTWMPGACLASAQPLTWTRVHRDVGDLGASAAPAARLLPVLSLGEDLGLGDGVV